MKSKGISARTQVGSGIGIGTGVGNGNGRIVVAGGTGIRVSTGVGENRRIGTVQSLIV